MASTASYTGACHVPLYIADRVASFPEAFDNQQRCRRAYDPDALLPVRHGRMVTETTETARLGPPRGKP